MSVTLQKIVSSDESTSRLCLPSKNLSIDVRTGFCFDRQEDFHYSMVLWFRSGNGIAKVTAGLCEPDRRSENNSICQYFKHIILESKAVERQN